MTKKAKFTAVAGLGLAAFACVLIPLRAGEHEGHRETNESRDKRYWKHAFSPEAIGRVAGGAVTGQVTNSPHEWGRGVKGFGLRFASGFGQHVISKGIQYPVSKLFHEEFSYRPSGKQGFGPRLKYALMSVVMTQKTTTGKRTVGKGRLAGITGSMLISRLWQPASLQTAGAAVGSIGASLGGDAAGNVLREFWPEIRHPHTHGKQEALTRRNLDKHAALRTKAAASRGRSVGPAIR